MAGMGCVLMDEFADALLMVKAGHPELAGWWGKLLGGDEKTFYAINPKQTGTGDPSPDNIRPILPGLTLTRDSGTTLNVYRGTLDAVEGTLTEETVLVVLKGDSSEDWTASKVFFEVGGAVVKSPMTNNVEILDYRTLSSHYRGTATLKLWVDMDDLEACIDAPTGRIGYKDTKNNGKTIATQKSYAARQFSAGTPIQFLLNRTYPATYHLTQAEVKRAVASLKR